MPEPDQPSTNSPALGRPEPSAVPPIRRTNYQLPPRPPVLDGIAPPPASAASNPVAPQPLVAPQLTPSATPQPQHIPGAANASNAMASPSASSVFTTPPPSRPIATPLPSAPLAQERSTKQQHPLRPYIAKAGLALGILLCLLGAIRWLASGTLSGKTVTLGAVVSTGLDPHSTGTYATKVQFVATDGKLHDLYLDGAQAQTDLVPGTALKVAYKAGQPDSTAIEWSQVETAHRTAIITLAIGGIVLIGSGIDYLVIRRKQKPASPTPQGPANR